MTVHVYYVRQFCPTCRLWRTHAVVEPGAAMQTDPGSVMLRCATCGTLGLVPRTFTCPRCGRTSANLNDTAEGYCGACHDWTGKLDEPV